MSNKKYHCTYCGQRIAVDDDYDGHGIVCPVCDKEFFPEGKPVHVEAAPQSAVSLTPDGMRYKVMAGLFCFLSFVLGGLLLVKQGKISKMRHSHASRIQHETRKYQTLVDRLERERASQETVHAAVQADTSSYSSGADSDDSSSGDEYSDSSSSSDSSVSSDDGSVVSSSPSDVTEIVEDASEVESSSSNASSDDSEKKWRKIYDGEMEKIESAYINDLNSLQGKYVKAVKTLGQTLQQQGDLDGVVAVKKEQTRLASDPRPPKNVVSEPLTLKRLQMSYQRGRAKIQIDQTKKVNVLKQKYIKYLDQLEKKYTKEGDLDMALKARKEKERVK